MDLQKIVNNAFYALVSGLLSYGVSLLKETTQRIASIEHQTYQLHTKSEVQKEINENIVATQKDMETRLRRQERCCLIKQSHGG